VLLAFASVLTIIAYPLSQDKGEHNTGQMDMTRDIPKKRGEKTNLFLTEMSKKTKPKSEGLREKRA